MNINKYTQVSTHCYGNSWQGYYHQIKINGGKYPKIYNTEQEAKADIKNAVIIACQETIKKLESRDE